MCLKRKVLDARPFKIEDAHRKIDAHMTDDLDWDDVYPFRSKSDRGLRMIRIPDIKKLVPHRIFVGLVGYDYIMVLNLLVLFLRDRTTFDIIMSTCLVGGIKTFIDRTRFISDFIKQHNMDDDFQFCVNLLEAQCLVGYRNLPDPDFDYWRDFDEFANAGHILRDAQYKMDRLQNMFQLHGQEPDIGFDTYVRSGNWLTSGSSSVGRFKVSVDGETFKIKARKNMLPFIMSADELIKLARECTTQENKVLMKNELAKVRLAVASDLGNYLLQSYFSYLLGDNPKHWPMSTVEETASEERARLKAMVRSTSRSYSLPFDYAAFDHQPSTLEIKVLIQRLADQLVCSTDTRLLLERMIRNFDNSFLSGSFEGVDKRVRITGGLMSGLRLTSLIGNMWNMWMTACATEFMSVFPLSSYVRGDDSTSFFNSYIEALEMRVGYEIMQAEGHESKFGILYEKSEFLRQMFSPTRVWAYGNRAAAGITQRKPWSGERWSPLKVIDGIFDACNRVGRRTGFDLSSLRDHLVNRVTVKAKIPRLIPNIPIALGGGGIWPIRSISAVNKLEFRSEIPVPNNFAVDLQVLRDPRLTKDQALVLAEMGFRNTIVSDDIPGISRRLRDRYNILARKSPTRALHNSFFYWTDRPIPVPSIRLDAHQMNLITLRETTWGKTVKENWPEKYAALRYLERETGMPRWMSRDMTEHHVAVRVNVESKFLGLLNELLMTELTRIRSHTVEGWVLGYNDIVEKCVAHVVGLDDYAELGRV